MKFRKFFGLLNDASSILEESLQITPENVHRIYEIFRNEYLKSTGQSWDLAKFQQRARNWIFYGDGNGFVAVRQQKSGFYKLVGAAGALKSKYKGFQQMRLKGLPIWGMVSKEIAELLEKLDFRQPNFLERKFLSKLLSSNVMGGAELIGFTKDGGAQIRYSDLGTVVKYFMGSPEYWKKLYSMK